jgi:DNA-binding XRE family transcriptional regulator
MSSLDVKRIRALTGKNQTEFAELFGVSRGAVTLWEHKNLEKRTKPKLSYTLKMKEIEHEFSPKVKIIDSHKEYIPEGRVIQENEMPYKMVTVIPVKGRGGLENVFFDTLYLEKLQKEKLSLSIQSSNGSQWFKI